jgi:hypothetical protein
MVRLYLNFTNGLRLNAVQGCWRDADATARPATEFQMFARFNMSLGCFAFGLGALASAGAAQAGGCGGECYRETVLPPVYGTVSERVLVRPSRTYDIVTPAEYRTVSETVEVSPARREWQVSYDRWGARVGCWVDVPARYAVRQRTVMVRPATSTPYTQYPVYGTRDHTVLVEPARRAWVPAGHGAPRYAEPEEFGNGPIRAAY